MFVQFIENLYLVIIFLSSLDQKNKKDSAYYGGKNTYYGGKNTYYGGKNTQGKYSNMCL